MGEMKKYLVLIGVILVWWGCHNPTPGYLETGNAQYEPDTMIIRKELDPLKDAYRKMNNAPWVSPKCQGVDGTAPVLFEIVDVTSEDGDAAMFKSFLNIRGGGRMEFPLKVSVPVGHYVVSVRVSNEGYSKVIPDVFTFIVE